MNAASEDSRLLYLTNPLTEPVRISGTPRVSLNASFSKPQGEPDGDPGQPAGDRQRHDPHARLDRPREPQLGLDDRAGRRPATFYRLDFDLQPKDVVVPAGRRLGLMVLSSDREHTVRPAPGTQVTLDVAGSALSLPVVGGAKALATATGGDLEEGTVSGTVPATLSLTLGGPASFGAFTPGVARDYLAADGGQRGQHGGRRDPERRRSERHEHGQARQRRRSRCRSRCRRGAQRGQHGTAYNNVGSPAVPLTCSAYPGPISNDAVSLEFKQSIDANDPLRTGTYSKTLTFTLSTTQP